MVYDPSKARAFLENKPIVFTSTRHKIAHDLTPRTPVGGLCVWCSRYVKRAIHQGKGRLLFFSENKEDVVRAYMICGSSGANCITTIPFAWTCGCRALLPQAGEVCYRCLWQPLRKSG